MTDELRARARALGHELDELGDETPRELRARARALGLDRLSEEHLEQFTRAVAGMARHLDRLPRDLPPAEEPAHIYRAKGSA
jgi:hypothetical protein